MNRKDTELWMHRLLWIAVIIIVLTATLVVAKTIIPQGNIDMKGVGKIYGATNITWWSQNGTYYECYVSNDGAFTCVKP